MSLRNDIVSLWGYLGKIKTELQAESRQFTDKTVHRHTFWRQFTDRIEDSSPTELKTGARQFVENHFADTTIGRIRLLVDATFRQVRHLVEKNSQVRHSVEIVKSLFFDQTSYSTERRIYQMLLIIKKGKS